MKRAAKSLFSKTEEDDKAGAAEKAPTGGQSKKKHKVAAFFDWQRCIDMLTGSDWDIEKAESSARAEYASALVARLKEAVDADSSAHEISVEECARLLEVWQNNVKIAFVMLSDQDAALKQI